MAENELAGVDVDPESIEAESAETAEPEPEQAAVEAEEEIIEEEPAPEPPTDEPPEPGEDKELLTKIEKLERRQLYLQRQLEKRPAAAPEPEEPPEIPAEAPKESDFETYEQYQEALVDFKVDSRIADYEVKQAQKGQQQGMQTFVQDLVTDGMAKFEDFEEVAMSITTPVTQQMVEIFKDCENPVDVAYHMGKNPQAAASISRMSRDAAVREITKIDLEIGTSGPATAPATPSTKPVTKAPPPIKPTRSDNVISKDPEKMTQAEYEKWREDGGGR